ncbi:MAG: hypothetical protein ACLRXB_19410 [Escherichia coli]
MTAREVMDIDEAREKYARGLAISLTDRQIDDQLLNRLRQSLEPHRSGTIPVHLYYQRAMHARDCVLARRGVFSERSFIKRSPWPHWFGAGGTGV